MWHLLRVSIQPESSRSFLCYSSNNKWYESATFSENKRLWEESRFLYQCNEVEPNSSPIFLCSSLSIEYHKGISSETTLAKWIPRGFVKFAEIKPRPLKNTTLTMGPFAVWVARPSSGGSTRMARTLANWNAGWTTIVTSPESKEPNVRNAGQCHNQVLKKF